MKLKHPILWVFVITLIALAIHPIPECFDCEFPNAWGRDDAAYARDAGLLFTWLVVASATAGSFSVRKYWLVPLSIVVAHLITQPLGGVALSSLWANEGPMILLMGGIAGMSSLAIGGFIGFLVRRFRRAIHPVRDDNSDC